MESELDVARAQIVELKAELEYERKARKKIESTNKRLAKEVSEERRGREALERVCEELGKEISSEINRAKREIEEERKMLRVAEVFREERVQMKLTEAKLLLEEKLLELEGTKQKQIESSLSSARATKNQEDNAQQRITNKANNFDGEPTRCVNILGDYYHKYSDSNIGTVQCTSMMQRRASPESTENPHIKRGIKGFVEFPKVVRAIGSKSRDLGTKLECQRSQLMILLKHKSLIRSNNLNTMS